MATRTSKLFSRLHLKFILRSIAVLLLGVVTFETISFWKMSEALRQLTLENMKSSVNNVSANIDDELSRLQTDLEIISGLPALEGFYLNRAYGLSNEALQYKEDIISFFKKQNARNSAYLSFKICDNNLQQIIYFSSTEKNRHSLDGTACNNLEGVSQLSYRAPEKGGQAPLLISRRKVMRAGAMLGILEINFDLTTYFERVNNSPLYQSGFLAVINRDGNILSTKNSARLAMQKYTQVLPGQSVDHPQMHYIEDQGGSGKTIMLNQSRLASIDWSIVAIMYENEIFEPVYAQLRLLIWVILAMLITETLFINYFTKHLITDRIAQLLSATKKILAGDYRQQIELKGNDEIAELSQSFNIMTRSLQSQLEKLAHESAELTNKKYQLQSIIDNSSAIISIKSVDGNYLLVNNAYANFFDMKPEDFTNKTDAQLFHKTLADKFRKNDLKVIKEKEAIQFDEEAIGKDQKRKVFITVKFPLFDETNNLYATCGIATDITARIEEKKALEKINQELLLSQTIIKTIEEGVLITNLDFEIVDVNQALVNLFGYSRKELIGSKPILFRSDIHPIAFFDDLYERLKTEGRWHGEIWERTKQGAIIPQLLTITSIKNKRKKVTNYVAVYSDITALKNKENELKKLAHFDSLTGLANRTLLEERTSRAIISAEREGHKVVMLFVDLDNFKYINDTLGHDIGDDLLKMIADRFSHIIREVDTLARQGGDEFVVLLSKVAHGEDAQIIAEKLKQAGSQPFKLGQHELYISTSIGISVYPDDASNTNELLKCSDMAMYAAKESGKNSFQFYSAKLNHAAVDRLKIEKALRKAIENNELQVYYQPIYEPHSLKVVKVEALVRWPQENGEFIGPDLFIPVAEESGLVVRLGEWVYQKALTDIQHINHIFNQTIRLSINLSARQFRHYDLANNFHDIAKRIGVESHLIEFEITESLLVDDYRLAEKILKQIHTFGFSLALDDFGTGYSSLSYLKHFPFDTIKMDRLFMQELDNDARNQSIVRASVEMGKALGMEMICEGIETQQQLDFVVELGEVLVQGFYLAKPENIDSLKALIGKQLQTLPND